MAAHPSRRSFGWTLAVCSIGLLALIVACGEETDPPPLEPPPQTVNQLVETTGWFPSFFPDSSAYAEARFDSAGGGGNLECVDFTGYQLREVSRLSVIAAASDVHYPGSVVQYASLGQVVPDPVTAMRAGGPLTLTAADGGTVSGEVVALDGDLVEEWRTQSVAEVTSPAGPWSLRLAEIRDPRMIAVAGGMAPTALPENVLEALAPTEGPRGRVLAALRRVHHTVTCPYPDRAGNAFGEEVLGADLADQMAEGNPPVWIGGGDYGQFVLLLIESDASFDETVAACLNSLPAALDDGIVEAGQPLVSELPGLTVTAYAVGADGDGAAAATAAGAEALATWLDEPVADPAALPLIAADLQALRNGGPLTLGVDTELSFTICEPYQAVFDDVLWSLVAADARTERRAGDLERLGDGFYYYDGGTRQFIYDHVVAWPDLRGGSGTAVPDPNGRDPVLLHDAANGRPAVELYELVLPDGHIYAQVPLDASSMANTQYTLFMVVYLSRFIDVTVEATPDPVHIRSNNNVNWMLHGEDDGQRHNLKVGFENRELMRYGHPPYLVDHYIDMPLGWHVYAFRFSANTGLSIWLDDEMLAEASWDYALLSFYHAKLCARWRGETALGNASLLLAEAVAYRGAGSDDDVLAELARLREKYGL
jgi:hypothetical protein